MHRISYGLAIALVAGLCFGRCDAAGVVPEKEGVQSHGPVSRTGFENLNGDGSDATDFAVGPVFFSGGVAGTRNFPPGYFKGHFAFITPGQLGIVSKIDFQPSLFNAVHFFGKDIRELTPDGRGTLIVKQRFLFFTTTRRVKLTDDWRPYTFLFVKQIKVESTGVSNLDTFTVVSF